MTCEMLQGLLSAAPKLRLAVIGDFCLDAYWFVDDSRSEKSVETGLMTRAVRSQRYSLGGAGNVVMNLRALGAGQVEAFGVIGTDPFGAQMSSLLRQAGVAPDNLERQESDWGTHVYIKPVRDDREEHRIDFGNFNALDDATAARLLDRLESRLPRCHAVIVNEQVQYGVHHSAFFRSRLADLIAAHPEVPFILDSRHYSDNYGGSIRKLNDHEALTLCGDERAPEELVLREEACGAAETLYARWQRPVFVTRGARGCLICDAAGVFEVPGLQIVGRIDTVGAGDSLLAGIALALGAGSGAREAATLGNFVAGVTVQKIFQTGVATPDEVMAIGGEPDYVYRPELAEDQRQARHVAGSEIEIVTALPAGPRPTHAIFDHDGTISTLRQGWEAVMEPMMVRAILGPRYADADEALYHKAVHRARDFIDKTTGIQTLTQMEGLVEMVREFACVPAAEILDAAGYKRIYLDALMERVRQRTGKLSAGELSVEDLTVKGAAAFLRRLCAQGVRLYMASGTDRDDVIREAEALGYAGLFEGRIYGAEAGVRTEAKKRVLERILKDVGAAGGALVTFGDGPVEIRETHKAGGYTVGVASDEVRRFGLDPGKRARLVRAGADLLVPDFSQGSRLLACLGLEGVSK
ncbi:MAG: PfkB family carbohydrate kinase [Kiritimatiellae bacterium]|nr:PfkB family carbohydrate kinase [Kiritimatiellia bacterium]